MSQASSFCHVCGAPLAQGAAFCSRCGTPVAFVGAPSGPSGRAAAQGPPPQPPWGTRNEKQEKREKQEKHEKHEKREKGRGDDLAGAVVGGSVLVFLGLLFYLAQSGMLQVTWGNWWEFFLVGLGVILIVQGLVRFAQHGHSPVGSFIAGAVLILVGLAFFASNTFPFWPLVLVVLGLAAIVSAFTGRRRTPAP